MKKHSPALEITGAIIVTVIVWFIIFLPAVLTAMLFQWTLTPNIGGVVSVTTGLTIITMAWSIYLRYFHND